ncbi:MAG: phosphatidate cytidylyltransferase [Paramuribaculum sp.]|nr:phosphatidate cytidylyltransferase [Paramuribaculum sp.]MDE5920415.1 phosphatidate cytidylyltransferase [Paramuribaculum sp.]
MNNLLLRSLTGLVYVALIVCSILFGGMWGFTALLALFAVLSTVEFHSLCGSGRNSTTATLLLDIAGSLAIVAAPALFATTYPYCGPLAACAAVATPCMAYLAIRLITQLYVTPDISPLASVGCSLSGQMYVALPLACAAAVYIISSPAIALLMFVMIWLNDTGAFCVGSMIGRRRLFERISPKKSWEGFFGGMAFCIICAIVIGNSPCDLPGYMTTATLAAYAVVACLFATWGDLVESLLKRTLKVKDSGRLMPGHGGILDRIDSLLLVAPATLIFLSVIIMIL